MRLSNVIDYIIETNTRFDETLGGSNFGRRSRSGSEFPSRSSCEFEKFDGLVATYVDFVTAAPTSWKMPDATISCCSPSRQVHGDLVSQAREVLARVLERSQSIFNGVSPAVLNQHTST